MNGMNGMNAINVNQQFMPKFPTATIQSLFPSNFITLNTTLPTTTNNVNGMPFSFGINNQNQFCSTNNVNLNLNQINQINQLQANNINTLTPTNPIANISNITTENKSSEQLLKGVPKIPLISQLQIN